MPTREETVREWVRKAQNDLGTAQRALRDDDPILDTGCFHCQQAVEKLLKGFLAWKGIPFPQIHTLLLLFDLCERADADFGAFRNSGEWLTRFAVQVRYPWGPDPTPEQAQKALADAESIAKFVLDLLPPEVHP